MGLFFKWENLRFSGGFAKTLVVNRGFFVVNLW
jgi:hypothetical protein